MWQRTSKVENVSIKLVTFAGVVQIGEVSHIDSHQNTLAIQREQELFLGNEAPFELFRQFYMEPEFEPIYENIRMTFHHLNPCIQVNNICPLAVSNSGLLHIGNGDCVNLNSRTLHIRQLSGLSANLASKKLTKEIIK